MNESDHPRIAAAEISLPLSLRLFGYLCILSGIGCVVAAVDKIPLRQYLVPLGAISIPAGLGILRLRKGWRKFLLFWLSLDLIALPAATALASTLKGPLFFHLFGGQGYVTVDFFGLPVWHLPPGIALASLTASAALAVWGIFVLSDARARVLFALPGPVRGRHHAGRVSLLALPLAVAWLLRIDIAERLDPGVRLEGRVTLAGEPVADAWVNLDPLSGPKDERRWRRLEKRLSVTTEADGSFAFERIPVGLARISTWDSSIAGLESLIEVRPAPMDPIELVVRETEVSGQVVAFGDGSPLSGIDVRADRLSDPPEAGFGERGLARTDAEGRYRILGLPPGDYRIRADPRPHTFYSPLRPKHSPAVLRPVAVREGAPAIADLAVVPGAVARVRVLDPNGRRVAGAGVTLVPVDAAKEQWIPLEEPEIWSDEDGIAEIGGLAPAAYRARAVSQERFGWSEPQDVTPTEATDFVVHVRPATRVHVQGRGRAGETIGDWSVLLLDSEGRPIQAHRVGGPGASALARRSMNALLPPGAYELMGRATGYAPVRMPVWIEPRSVQVVEVPLRRE